MRSPVAVVPMVASAVEPPISRRPQRVLIGSKHPRSRNPVVSALRKGPVAGSPDVVRTRRFRLVIFGQLRRWSRGVVGIVSVVVLGFIRRRRIVAVVVRVIAVASIRRLVGRGGSGLLLRCGLCSVHSGSKVRLLSRILAVVCGLRSRGVLILSWICFAAAGDAYGESAERQRIQWKECADLYLAHGLFSEDVRRKGCGSPAAFVIRLASASLFVFPAIQWDGGPQPRVAANGEKQSSAISSNLSQIECFRADSAPCGRATATR